MNQEMLRDGENDSPVSPHHPASFLHPAYRSLALYVNEIPTCQDVLNALHAPTFIRHTRAESAALTEETVERTEQQIAGALFERFAFVYTQLLFPHLYSPQKTSEFCNILIRRTVDRNSEVIRYPFGTFSINHDMGSPDGLIVVDDGLPRVPLWFEYTAQREHLEEKIKSSYDRFQGYKDLCPQLFLHTKIVMMMPSPTVVDPTRLPNGMHCATVPITRMELGGFVKDIMSMTDDQPESVYFMAFPAEPKDRRDRKRIDQQHVDSMLGQLIRNPSLWETLPPDMAEYCAAKLRV